MKKTASIIGVEITDPEPGYTSPPLVSFGDRCNQGYGAYGKANIDKNPNSPTYGQVTSVTMTSIGENYPVDASKTTVNGKFPEVYIDDIIIEDPDLIIERVIQSVMMFDQLLKLIQNHVIMVELLLLKLSIKYLIIDSQK